MKIFILLLALGSTSAMADFSFGLSDSRIKQSTDTGSWRERSQSAYIGLNKGLSENLALSLRLGYGEIGTEDRQFDRYVRLMPKYTVYRLNQDGSVYLTAGVGAHSILSHGRIDTGSGLIGLGFENNLKAEGFYVSFEAVYEESLKTDHELDNVRLVNYSFRSIETSLTLSYKL